MSAISEVTIRRTRREDVGVIVAMLADDPLGGPRERIEDPLPESYLAAFERLQRDPNILLVVAEDGEGLAGYAMVRIHEGPDDSWALEARYGEVWTILVTERARGRGLGSALLDEVDAVLARRGIRDLMIGVMEGNDDARRLYERRGLVPGWRQLYRLAAAER